jgi:hypothetical protein
MKPNYRRLLWKTIETLQLYNRDDSAAFIKSRLELGMVSEIEAKGYLMALQPLAREVERRHNLLNRTPELEEIYPEKKPDLVIGEMIESEDVPVGFFLNDAMHVIFAGNAGSGKTTSIYNFVLAVNKYNQEHPEDFICLVIWIITDGSLLAIAQVIDNCIVASATRGLRISLQPPSGVPYRIWNNRLGEIISARGFLKAGSISVTEMLNFLVEAMNTNPSPSGFLYPSFENLYELSNKAPKRLFESKEQYQLSLNQVLRQFAQSTGDLFKAHRSLILEDIVSMKKHLIIDARGLLPQWVRAATSDILLAGLFLGREYRNESNPRRCMILWDEADEDVSRIAEEQYK